MKNFVRFRSWLIIYHVMFSSLVFAGPYTINTVSTSGSAIDFEKDGAWNVEFSAGNPVTSQVLIYDKDLRLVQTLSAEKLNTHHKLRWDGMDFDGNRVVPGLYFFRVQTTDEDGIVQSYDELMRMAGQNTLVFWPKWNAEKQEIGMRLERDALVRLRVGLKDGPLLITPADWVPMKKGKPVVAWDGWDEKHAMDYSDADNLEMKAEAISLPVNYIVVTDSKRDPKQQNACGNWISEVVAFNSDLDSKKYRLAKSIAGQSRAAVNNTITLRAEGPVDEEGVLRLKEPVKVVVEYPAKSRAERKEQFYEVLYYLDGVFLSEDPLGDDEISFELNPRSMVAGEHTFTVNVILGSNRIGTASLRFVVE